MARIAAAWIAATLMLVAGAPWAQPLYPSHPVKIIVPFPGGGTNDVLARIIADKLQTKWSQPFVIENKTGAAGNIGADAAYHSEPDGYTLLVSPPGPLAINQSLYKQLSYNPREFVSLTVLGSVPNVVVVRKELPVDSLEGLIQYLKAHPGKLTVGSQGSGGTPHLTAVMFAEMTGTEMVHVPYRGETLVFQDMLGGHVDVFFGNIAGARSLFLEGKVKILAVADAQRSPALPAIPTTAQAGLPGLVSTAWFAFAAPPKTSTLLQTIIADAANEAIRLPDVQAKFRAVTVEPIGNSPAEMTAFVAEEAKRWGEVIRKNNIVVE